MNLNPRDFEVLLADVYEEHGYKVIRPANSGATNGGGHGDVVVEINGRYVRLDVKAWEKKPPPTDKWGNICVWARVEGDTIKYEIDPSLFDSPPLHTETTKVYKGKWKVVVPLLDGLKEEVKHDAPYRERVVPLTYPCE